LNLPDFLVGTKHALVIGMQASMFEELTLEQRRGTLLVQVWCRSTLTTHRRTPPLPRYTHMRQHCDCRCDGVGHNHCRHSRSVTRACVSLCVVAVTQGLDDEVHGTALHPYLPQLALVTYSGAVHIWDYDTKQLLLVRLDARLLRPSPLIGAHCLLPASSRECRLPVSLTARICRRTVQVRLLNPVADRPHTVAYDTQGRFLAVGTTSGKVFVLDPNVLTDTQRPLSHGKGAIVDIKFSPDGVFMATADADRCVHSRRMRVNREQWEGRRVRVCV
jgi:WD40 repeat protein